MLSRELTGNLSTYTTPSGKVRVDRNALKAGKKKEKISPCFCETNVCNNSYNFCNCFSLGIAYWSNSIDWLLSPGPKLKDELQLCNNG